MLKLICDHCGFEIELIHKLNYKIESFDDGDKRSYWDISNEQDGVGFTREGKYFDYDPNELDKWDVINNVGTYGKDSIQGHFCHQCKEEYRQYLKDYAAKKISLDDLLKDEELLSVEMGAEKFISTAKKLKEKLDNDYREYKQAFLKKSDTK